MLHLKEMVYEPGSSRSGLLSSNGPWPGFGAAINVRLDTSWPPWLLLILGRALVRKSLVSIALAAGDGSTHEMFGSWKYFAEGPMAYCRDLSATDLVESESRHIVYKLQETPKWSRQQRD